jgi:chromosome segregation ATPase
MSDSKSVPGPRGRVRDALSVLRATPTNDVKAVRQTFRMLEEVLGVLDGALGEMEAELEGLTGPDRDLTRENLELRKAITAAEEKRADAEQKLVFARADLDTERAVHAEEGKKLKDLEKKTKGFEDLLMSDDDAFDRYFEQAVDKDLKKRGNRPPRG